MNISFVFECNPTLPILFGTIRMGLVEMKVCDEQWNKNGCNLKWNIRTIQTLQLCTKHNSNATFHGNTFNFQSIVAFDIKQTIYYFLFHHKTVWMLSGHFTTFQIQYYRVFFVWLTSFTRMQIIWNISRFSTTTKFVIVRTQNVILTRCSSLNLNWMNINVPILHFEICFGKSEMCPLQKWYYKNSIQRTKTRWERIVFNSTK